MPRGPVAPGSLTLEMAGRIRVGRWMQFTATQRFEAHAFEWRARAGSARFKPLHVVDTYSPGRGSTRGTLLGRIPFMSAESADTARAAAGRAAAESIWVPHAMLGADVVWRAEHDRHIVARVDVPPEQIDLHLFIDDDGRPTRVELQRWGNVGQKEFGYIPFGGDIIAERTFGPLTLPSQVSVGWWFGTERYQPFFQATILDATLEAVAASRGAA